MYSPLLLYYEVISIEYDALNVCFKLLKYVELPKMTAVNMQHVLTQGLEPIPVRVIRDILEMGKSVKVIKLKKRSPIRDIL